MFYVVFHYFRSANCCDITIIAKAGTDKFGRNLLSAGSRLSKLAGKEAQIQTAGNVVVRHVMLLSAARAWGPTLSSLYNTLKDGYAQASQVWLELMFCGSWKFQKLLFWGGHFFFSLSYLHSLQTAWYFPEAVVVFLSRGTGEVRFNNIETWTVQRKAPVWCTVESPEVKRDNWRCKACMFDWVGGWSQEC